MPEVHLKQPGFTLSACKAYKKNKERIKKNIFIKINQIKLAFNMTWLMEIQDLVRLTASNKVVHSKAFDIANNLKYNGRRGEPALIVYKFLDKNPSSSKTF